MGVHVYCIVPSGLTPPRGQLGIEDAAVTLSHAQTLGVWTSAHEQPPAASVEGVRVHNEVVRAAMSEEVTPVPIRFGQWFAAEAIMAERIAEEHARWSGLLERFAGRAEHGTTFVTVEEDAARDVRPAGGSTGTAYMQQLARRQADAATRRELAQHLADDITERLGGIDVETELEIPPAGPVLARLAHLVAWRDVNAYHAVMREVRGSRQDVAVHLTGPWPPWSFT